MAPITMAEKENIATREVRSVVMGHGPLLQELTRRGMSIDDVMGNPQVRFIIREAARTGRDEEGVISFARASARTYFSTLGSSQSAVGQELRRRPEVAQPAAEEAHAQGPATSAQAARDWGAREYARITSSAEPDRTAIVSFRMDQGSQAGAGILGVVNGVFRFDNPAMIGSKESRGDIALGVRMVSGDIEGKVEVGRQAVYEYGRALNAVQNILDAMNGLDTVPGLPPGSPGRDEELARRLRPAMDTLNSAAQKLHTAAEGFTELRANAAAMTQHGVEGGMIGAASIGSAIPLAAKGVVTVVTTTASRHILRGTRNLGRALMMEFNALQSSEESRF